MKKILKMTLMLIIALAIGTSTVSAVYQVKPNATSTTAVAADDFFYNIRNMEAEGQVLGLTETVDTTTGLATEGSNDLDCHMMKNTEYGIVALFSASGFGDVPQGYETTIDGPSTTQNETGVYQMVNFSESGKNEKLEFLAAVNSDIGTYGKPVKLRNSVDTRYVDIYNSTSYTDYSSAKVGDATRETINWFGASLANFVYSSLPTFVRGGSGLFSFEYGSGQWEYRCATRPVIVCGEGL